MSDVFEERHVVVTGGTGALGRAVVSNLLERNAIVHVPVYRESELEGFEHREDVQLEVGVDFSHESSASKFFGSLPRLWGSVQIVGGFAMGPIAETTSADFERMLRLNAVTCFNCCRAAVAKIREGRSEGRLVNIAARPALVPAADMAAYAASKAAVASLTQCLAEELAPERIWVNAVVPSIMDTPANRRAMPDADHDTWPDVAEVAETISFLLSPENAVTRGALVPVYGRA